MTKTAKISKYSKTNKWINCIPTLIARKLLDNHFMGMVIYITACSHLNKHEMHQEYPKNGSQQEGRYDQERALDDMLEISMKVE